MEKRSTPDVNCFEFKLMRPEAAKEQLHKSRHELMEQILHACQKANGPKFLLSVDVPLVTLADVLLALQSSSKMEKIAVLEDGRFAICKRGGLDLLPEACWNLRSNHLEEQSRETLEQIAFFLRS